ncbi:hypothetical protein [Brevibacterium paucivorans]
MENVVATSFEELDVSFDVVPGETVFIDIEIKSDQETEKAAVLEVVALTEECVEAELPDAGHSNAYSNYFYVASSSNEYRNNHFEFQIPDDVVTLKFKGHLYGNVKSAFYSGQLIFNAESQPESLLTTPCGKDVELYPSAFKVLLHPPEGATSARISVKGVAGDAESRTPVSVELRDELGKILLPPTNLAVSPTVGSYFYVSTSPESTQEITERQFGFGEDTREIVIRGNTWNDEGMRIKGAPKVEWKRSAESLWFLEDFLYSIDADEPLWIVDTTDPPVGDDTRDLRPNNLVRELNKLGHHVLFFPFSSIGEMSERPLLNVCQTNREHFDDAISMVARRRKGKSTVYVCSSFPSLSANGAVDVATSNEWQTLYIVRDDMEEFNRVGYSKWYTSTLERRMIERAERVITVSPALQQKVRSLTVKRDVDAHVIPNAVREEVVERANSLRTSEAWRNKDLAVGYVGRLTPSWFDWDAVLHLARALPEARFEIIGHGAPTLGQVPSNVSILGPKTHEEIETYALSWRVGLIPLIQSPLSVGVDPNKLFEYLAWGLRTVSSPMGSVDTAPSTWVYQNPQELVNAVTQALHQPMTDEELSRIDQFATENTWSARAQRYVEMMGFSA